MSNRNSPAESPPVSPSALPLAVITVNERGTMTVSYDGSDFPPSTTDASWSRARCGDVIEAVSAHRTRTVRVEVPEFDRSVFPNNIHAERREHAIAELPLHRHERTERH